MGLVDRAPRDTSSSRRVASAAHWSEATRGTNAPRHIVSAPRRLSSARSRTAAPSLPPRHIVSAPRRLSHVAVEGAVLRDLPRHIVSAPRRLSEIHPIEEFLDGHSPRHIVFAPRRLSQATSNLAQQTRSPRRLSDYEYIDLNQQQQQPATHRLCAATPQPASTSGSWTTVPSRDTSSLRRDASADRPR